MKCFIPTRDGKKLAAIIRRPKAGKSRFPVVLFVVGLGMNLHEWNNSHDEIAQKLLEVGFLTLQFSFNIFYPRGRVKELSLDQRKKQLEDVYNWLRDQPEVDQHRIGVHATSFGVPTAMLADLSLVRVYVFVSGAYFPYESIQRVLAERNVKINYVGDTTLPHSTGESTTVGREFWSSVAKFNLGVVGKKLTQPVLMLHGDGDTKITVAETRQAFVAVASQEKKLRIFVGGDHGFTDVPRALREDFLQEIVAWFRSYL